MSVSTCQYVCQLFKGADRIKTINNFLVVEWISGTIQFISSAPGKTLILSKVLPNKHSFPTNLNNKHINCFYSVSPLEQLANVLTK